MSSYGEATSLGSHQRPPPGAYPSPPSSPTITTQQSLSQAVHARRSEYTKPYKIRVKIGSWNVASLSGTEKDLDGWFVQGKGVSERLSGIKLNAEDVSNKKHKEESSDGPAIEGVTQQEERHTKKQPTIPQNDPGLLPGNEDIGLYVLGLQEVVDISSVGEALRPWSDPGASRKWKEALLKALPEGYKLVAEQQLVGLLLLICAADTIAPTISSVSTTNVGTGLMGYMGNKGAVTARIVLGETTRMVFINCHLAAGNERGSVERRNADALTIRNRTRFAPVHDGNETAEELGEGIGDEDFAFWFGDLNYRLEDMPGEDVRRLLLHHTRNEYDTLQASLKKINKELGSGSVTPSSLGSRSRSSEDCDSPSRTMDGTLDPSPDRKVDREPFDITVDPSSLQMTISSLLAHDQLHHQMHTRKSFHDGWREGPITFLPTYKYDVGSVGMFDSSEKKRGPSWCDRILFRTRRDKIEYEQKIEEAKEALRRDEEMKGRGLDKSVDDEVFFDYDPDTDGAEEGYEEPAASQEDTDIVTTKLGFEDRLQLEYYTSHQRVLSSDHKPLDAVFALTYEAVDLKLKDQIRQEVARELDKAENEGRPVITIVVDRNIEDDDSHDESVNFGHIRYDHPKSRTMTIANTGRAKATFGFIDRHAGGVTPSWLTVQFDRPSDNDNPNPTALREYTLEPGETANVELTVRIIDIDQVRALNGGESKIEDVLVLRVRDGRDHFVPLRGVWLQSSFGHSLDKLVRLPEDGVRRLQHQRPDASKDRDVENAVKSSAPREIFRLTEAIEESVERAFAEWGMKNMLDTPPWDIIGWPFQPDSWIFSGKEREYTKYEVREALDTGQAFKFAPKIAALEKAEVLAEVFLLYLSSLEDGIIDERLCKDLFNRQDEREKSKEPLSGEEERSWILEVLSVSPINSASFTFISFMLSRVANEIAPLRSLPSSPSTPRTPAALMSRNWSLSQDPALAKRRQVDRKFAEIFAKAIFKTPLPGKGKERKAAEDRRKNVIEVFVRSKWEEAS